MDTGDTLVVELEVDNDDGEVIVGKQDPYQSSNLPSKEYVVHQERRTWEDAEESCAIAGGHLPSIHSGEQLDHLGSIIPWDHLDDTVKQQVWLGGTDSWEEGVWRWTDGTPWNYTRWVPGAETIGIIKNSLATYMSIVMEDLRCNDYRTNICHHDLSNNTITSPSKMEERRKPLCGLTNRLSAVSYTHLTLPTKRIV